MSGSSQDALKILQMIRAKTKAAAGNAPAPATVEPVKFSLIMTASRQLSEAEMNRLPADLYAQMIRHRLNIGLPEIRAPSAAVRETLRLHLLEMQDWLAENTQHLYCLRIEEQCGAGPNWIAFENKGEMVHFVMRWGGVSS